MARLTARLTEAVRRVRKESAREPRVALFLEGGETDSLGLEVEAAFPVNELLELDHDPADGGPRIELGRLNGVPAAVVRGIRPRHGGLPLREATLPVRLAGLLGPAGRPPAVLLAGSCESLLPLSAAGDLALLDDHISLMADNPLIGPNEDALGPRFPDLSHAYDRDLQRVALEEALAARIPLHRGVLVAVPGPQSPTRAEYRMMRWMGGDFVASWIAPEVIVARHMGMPVLALLSLSRVCLPDAMSSLPTGATEISPPFPPPALAVLLRRICGRIAAALPEARPDSGTPAPLRASQ